jgi:hypothetical protein
MQDVYTLMKLHAHSKLYQFISRKRFVSGRHRVALSSMTPVARRAAKGEHEGEARYEDRPGFVRARN